MEDDEATLIPERAKRFSSDIPVNCPECVFDAEEIDMSDIRREDLPAHDHPVPQHVTDQLKRHEMYIDQLQGENSRMFGSIETGLEFLKGQISEINSGWRELSKRLDEQEKKLDRYNNLRERMDLVEQTHDRLNKDYVPRQEFNGAVGSLRDQLRSSFATMQWILGGVVAAAASIAAYVIFGG